MIHTKESETPLLAIRKEFSTLFSISFNLFSSLKKELVGDYLPAVHWIVNALEY